MTSNTLRVFALLAISPLALAQSFEVASVKPSTPNTKYMMKGGPGSSDPARIQYSSVTLMDLITKAYHLEKYQVTGPKWLRDAKYEVSATLAPGSTKAEMGRMLQALLKERFGLEIHQETQELAVYTLVVDKNGPKLQVYKKKEENESTPDEADISRVALGKDRLPIMPPNFPGHFIGMSLPGKTMFRARNASLDEFAHLLMGYLDHPVFDETQLKETYDFGFAFSTLETPQNAEQARLHESTAMLDPGVDIFGAVKSQLGLRLESGKRQVQMLIVDRVERLPSEN